MAALALSFRGAVGAGATRLARTGVVARQLAPRALCMSSATFPPPPDCVPGDQMSKAMRRRVASLEGLHASFEQLEEAQMVIDVAEGKVDAKAGAALARETGTLRVNPSAPFVVSTQT